MVKKTVLITGANRGLGYQLASIFNREDWSLILHSRESRPDICLGPTCSLIQGDLRDDGVISSLVLACSVRNVDVVINNAGGYLTHYLNQMGLDEFGAREIMNTNFWAPVILTKRIFDAVYKKRGRGLFVNINSLAGKESGKGEMYYGASKQALNAATQSMRWESNGVQFLNVFLGAMKTDMTKHRPDYNDLISPKNVAELIFMLSDLSTKMRINVEEVVVKRSR